MTPDETRAKGAANGEAAQLQQRELLLLVEALWGIGAEICDRLDRHRQASADRS